MAFDGFVRPCLLDGLALPHFVTPTISLDIGSSRICESRPILYHVTALQVGSVNISHCQNSNRVRVVSRSQTPPLFDIYRQGRVW